MTEIAIEQDVKEDRKCLQTCLAVIGVIIGIVLIVKFRNSLLINNSVEEILTKVEDGTISKEIPTDNLDQQKIEEIIVGFSENLNDGILKIQENKVKITNNLIQIAEQIDLEKNVAKYDEVHDKLRNLLEIYFAKFDTETTLSDVLKGKDSIMEAYFTMKLYEKIKLV